MTSLVKDAPVYLTDNYIDTETQNLILEELKDLPFDYHESNGHKLARKTLVMISSEQDMDIPPYWGTNVHVCQFTPEMERLRLRLIDEHKFEYNVCLLNMYDNGRKNIGWHCDREEQGSTLNIASVSIGAERMFKFKSMTTNEKVQVLLKSGTLLWMRHPCQSNYLHALSRDDTTTMRMNMTFRLFRNFKPPLGFNLLSDLTSSRI